MTPIAALSFAVSVGGAAVGTVQCWPVVHRANNGAITPLVMVGPVAVLPGHQQQGLGRCLMDAVMAAAPGAADGALMMIGDPDYYGRFFGFSADPTGRWRLPGPFDPHRLLAADAGDHAVPAWAGEIGPRSAPVLAP
ncbi:MAG: GNAT family N-acetyltransferase [Sphingopyxis sp.]|nr:GNAT family N-acetyltransferase [Sphingopyxis sp.]